MHIEPSNRVTVRVAHLKYLQNGLGMGGLMNDFRADECHKFMYWLQSEIDRLEDNLPSGYEIGIVEVVSEVINIAIFCFSKLAYKILCDTRGMIVPTNLLEEVKCLEAYRDNKKMLRTRRFKGNIWDTYSNKESWLESVVESADEFVRDIIKTLAETDEVELELIEFNPSGIVLMESQLGTKPQTSHDLVVVDLIQFSEEYNKKDLQFNELAFTEEWNEYGWFSHDDWSIVLLAKVAVQVVESYRLTLKRHYRRVDKVTEYDRYSSQEQSGYIDAYKMIRQTFVEPRMELEGTLDKF